MLKAENTKQQKSSKELEEYRDITSDVEESEFIPYASHYSFESVLTKNGELLQVIRIDSNNNLSDKKNIREAIRAALAKNIVSDDYAVWISTIRLSAKSSTSLYSDNEFVNKLDKKWNETLKDALYYNEVFVTIVRVGQEINTKNPINFVRSLSGFLESSSRKEYLKQSAEELNFVTNSIVSDLSDLGAKKLTLEQRNGVYYSEVCEFLGKLINLRYLQFPLIPVDMSEDLTRGEVSFAYDAMEVREDQGRRRFGSMITVKEYKDCHADVVNKLFHVPAEFVVTQMISFASSKDALSEYKKQAHYLNLSGDKELYESTGLKDIIESDQGRIVDFGESQLSIFMLADTTKKLEQNVKNTMKFLGSYGISSIREDMFLQDCYWAQLPANFEFVKRLKYVNTKNVGGYVNLSGNFIGARSNPWGVKVTSFWNVYRNIYNFNFHDGRGIGHTCIVGPYGSGKSLLGNFLLTQSQKYKPNMFYFDVSDAFGPLSKKLAFEEIEIKPDAGFELNPFDLKDSDNNQSFLLAWFSILLGCAKDPVKVGIIEHALKSVLQLDQRERNFGIFYQFIEDDELKKKLEKMLDTKYLNGKNNAVLDKKRIYFNIKDFDVNNIEQKSILTFAIYYLTLELNGDPTVFYLDEGFGVLGNSIFAGTIDAWMDNLNKKNAISIFSTEYPEEFVKSGVYDKMKKSFGSQIFMPDAQNGELYKKHYNFSDIEMKYMSKMSPDACHFMVKKSDDATNVCIIEKESLGEFTQILEGEVVG